MIDQDKEEERHTIDVLLEKDHAFELRLVREDGKDSIRCIVMGGGRPGRVHLSSGRYSAHLRLLSDAPTRTLSREIEISASTRELDLVQLFQGDQYRPISAPHITELTKAVRQSKQRESSPLGESNFFKRKDLTFETLAEVRSADPSLHLHPSVMAPRFEIGISHNAADSESGWQSAENLIINHDIVQNGTLSITVRDEGQELNIAPRRVRLTLAIEGRSAIRTPLPLFKDGVRVSVAPLWINGEPDGLIRVEAVNLKKQALVAALSSLEEGDAISMVNWSADSNGNDAMEILLHKKKDLWAATVAALLLAKTYQLKEVADWAFNLENFAPHISDAGVTAAWARATDMSIDLEESERLTLKHLIRSRKIGSPTFKVTHSIALELLNAISGSSKNAELREKAREEMTIWTRRASRRLFEGPYIMWEQAGESLQSGRLPPERYLSILKGCLKRDGFEVAWSLGQFPIA